MCWLTCKKFSADKAPRVPPEKLSIKRTQWRSKGTVVPPDVTHTTGRVRFPAEHSVRTDASAALQARKTELRAMPERVQQQESPAS